MLISVQNMLFKPQAHTRISYLNLNRIANKPAAIFMTSDLSHMHANHASSEGKKTEHIAEKPIITRSQAT